MFDRPLEPGLRAPGPLVRASIGITGKACSGTISSARPQRAASLCRHFTE